VHIQERIECIRTTCEVLVQGDAEIDCIPHFDLHEGDTMSRQTETTGYRRVVSHVLTDLELSLQLSFATPCARQEGCNATLQGPGMTRLRK